MFFLFEMIRTLEGEREMAKTAKKARTRAKAKKAPARKTTRRPAAKARKRKAA
jgi:hypothetical protein